MTPLSDFRKAKDDFFKTDHQSPLDQVQQRTFAGLNYYPENPHLRFDLLLEKMETPEHISMATSTGEEQDYLHVGQIRFDVQGQETSLQVYVSEMDGEYFIPFVDATAPAETYGAGRYLEPEDLGGGKLHVDFNLAYNPYCAYNDAWSCPVPPHANRISVRIEAGEKKYHK
ncbi:MAG: DUF1684 domain-containing protein [Anaerolineales bacterium]